MEQWQISPIELFVFPPAAALALLIACWRGWLRRSVFDDAPKRAVGLTALDLGIGLTIMFGGMILTLLTFQLLGIRTPDAAAGQPKEELSSIQQACLALFVQALTQLPVVLFLLYRVWGRIGNLRALGVLPSRPVREIGSGVAALLLALPVVGCVNLITVLIGITFHQPRPDIGHEMLKSISQAESVWASVLLISSAVIAAPLLEEGVFRGLVQTCLLDVFGRDKRWRLVLTTALLFTLIHTQVPWQVRPGLFALGVILGWLYERYGSLLACLVVHAGFNAVNVMLFIVVQSLAG